MKYIIYIFQYNKLQNGHSIFDERLINALSKILPKDNFQSISFDEETNSFRDSVRVSEIDSSENIIIFSHFNTFKISPKFKHSRIFFINHDLPYHAYFLNFSFINLIKGIYIKAYLKYYWKYSDYIFFISAIEQKEISAWRKNTAHIKVGVKPLNEIPVFKSIASVAIFTGNYKWSLKKQSLVNTFKTGYSGKIKLIAVNADENVFAIANKYNMVIDSEYAEPYVNQVKIGIITDHFLSGFKLKALELIRMGCCLLSFVDIFEEFNGIKYADIFIRKINSLNEMDDFYDYLNNQQNIIEKYNIFYMDVIHTFNWEVSARHILSVAQNDA